MYRISLRDYRFSSEVLLETVRNAGRTLLTEARGLILVAEGLRRINGIQNGTGRI